MASNTYRTVHELNEDELNELKDAYFDQLQYTEDADTFESADDIPNEIIFDHYEDIGFVKEDFFCNTNSEVA